MPMIEEVDLEVLYPELKTMKSSEIFIEWAYIVKGFGMPHKIHLRRIIPKREQNAMIKALKLVYNVKGAEYYKDEDVKLFECINLVTIEK
jgi:hypothetical protein